MIGRSLLLAALLAAAPSAPAWAQQRPRPVAVDIADAWAAPTIGMRARAAAVAAPAPGEVVAGVAECTRASRSPRFRRCTVEDSALTPARRDALARLALGYVFPDDPSSHGHQLARFTVSVSDADLRPLSFADGPTIDTSAGMMAQRPTWRSTEREYPIRAVIEAIEADIELLCRVEADLSLTCIARPLAPGAPHEAAFLAAALNVSHEFVANPAFPDGRPTPGERVRIQIRFRVADTLPEQEDSPAESSLN